jgi:thymidylate synthase
MSTCHDHQYLDLVRHVIAKGVRKPNRTGVDTIGVFGYHMRFDLRDGSIPLLTTKQMHTRSIIHELLWYLQGDTNIKYLTNNKVTIWDEWADENGDLGPVYGHQWRSWRQYKVVPAHVEGTEWIPNSYRVEFIDQIAALVDKLRTNPNDRRMIVSAWNVGELEDMALPPCHYTFQCYVKPNAVGDLELSLMLNQRSCDVGLGVPFNIVQYSILLRMLAWVVGMVPGELIWNGGDVHIYENHVEPLLGQLTNQPYPSPVLSFARSVNSIDDFKYEDFQILGYQSHGKIPMVVAV